MAPTMVVHDWATKKQSQASKDRKWLWKEDNKGNERMKAEAMKACNGWKNPEMHATVARQSGGISMTTWLMEISWRDNDLQLFIAVVH